MRQSRKTRRRTGSLQTVSQVLPVVGEQLNLTQKIQEWSVLTLWEQVIDSVFQGKTQAVRLKKVGQNHTLLVNAANSVIATELSFFLEQYRERLNAYAPETGLFIHQITLQGR